MNKVYVVMVSHDAPFAIFSTMDKGLEYIKKYKENEIKEDKWYRETYPNEDYGPPTTDWYADQLMVIEIFVDARENDLRTEDRKTVYEK